MRKRDRQKLISYAINEYSDIFDRKYERSKISNEDFLGLLENCQYPSMCEWSYCCNGLYDNCWQELIEESIWGYTKAGVKALILEVFKDLRKEIRKDSRIAFCKDKYGTHAIIVARDLPKHRCDYLIIFRDNELEWVSLGDLYSDEEFK